MSIYVTRSSMPTLEEYMEEIRPIFESHHLTNMGPIYQRLEAQLKDYLAVPHLSMFVNGHMALETAIRALLPQKQGGEIITTPFTFVSTTHAIVRNGFRPVFCDIRPEDFTMDPAKIEALITENTVAILPVHVYGNICDVDAIQQIADRHGLKLIYDAAHAFGVQYKGAGIGNFGDAAMFSFHATKVFNTIEGGAVAFRDDALCQPLHELKNFGQHGEDVLDFGGNAKMDEFRAAMGICNLRRIEDSILSRKAVVLRYQERLGQIPGLRVWQQQVHVRPNYAYFPVSIDAPVFGRSRDDVFQTLMEHDIFARKYFYPAINDMHCYAGKFCGDTPIAHAAAASVLTLPLYEGLELPVVDQICDIIAEMGGKNGSNG